MFWKYNSQSTSQIDALLDKADVGLTEVLEQEDIIQECKNQNRKLVDYLVNPDVLSELIGLIITEPSKEIEESARFRLPHIAAEILSCEVPQINEQVSSDENMLKKLYSFLEQEPPLNPLLSSFFSKAFGVLITRKSEQNIKDGAIQVDENSIITENTVVNVSLDENACCFVLEVLRKHNFVDDILRHIGTSSVPDMVIHLIRTIKTVKNTCKQAKTKDVCQSFLKWLNEKRLVQATISLLDSKVYGRDVHDNASRLLIELLRVSRDGQFLPASERCDDPLLAVLESPSTVHLLLDQMFMHIKCSNYKESDKSDTLVECKSEDNTTPPDENNMQNSSNVDDAGGGDNSAFPDESCESVLVNGISVLLAILETRKAVNNSYITNDYLDACSTGIGGGSGEGMGGMLTTDELLKHQGQLNQTVNAMIPRLHDITKLLTNPPYKPELKTTSGTLCPPFGSTRLSVVKLISALLSTNIYEINVQFRNLKTIDILLDLFFKYSLNNFLHAQVEQCITFLFTWNPQQQLPDISKTNPEESYLESNKDTETLDAMSNENEEDKSANIRTSPQDSSNFGDENLSVSENERDQNEDSLTGEETMDESSELTTPEDKPSVKMEDVNKDCIKDDEEMKQELESSEGIESDDMNEDAPNPDLEWETTAIAEAKKLAEIKSNIPYSNPLLTHLYIDCKIVDRVVNAWEENEGEEPRRKGYMGHLTRIANTMQHHTENKTLCHEFVTDLMGNLSDTSRTGWERFVTGKLAEINERNTIIPATSYSAGTTLTSSEDDDSDFREIQFQSESLQQIFSDYQMQQMSDNFIDSFGFNEEEFNEGDDGGGGSMKRLASINFGLDEVTGSSDQEEKEQRDLFEVVCKQRFSGEEDVGKRKDKLGEDSDDLTSEEEDPWESRTKEIEFGSNLFSSGTELNSPTEALKTEQTLPTESTTVADSPNKNTNTEKTEVVNPHANSVSNELSESDSSDDDIIIDRTEETSIKVQQQSSDESKMETDVAHDSEDPWETINDHTQPSEVAPIDMDTTANPWESAGAASSPTPASPFNAFEFPSGSPHSTAPVIVNNTTSSEKESNATTATNDSGWANFSAFDQNIEPAANPLLVTSPNPSNNLTESSSSTKFPSKASGLENSDDISNHKSEAAIALNDGTQIVKNSDTIGSDKCDPIAGKEMPSS